MEINNEEIVLYIYHMNKAGPVPEEKNRPGAAGQREKQLSSAFLARAASHYAARHCPARNHPAAGRSLMLAYPERQPWKALLPGLPLASFFHQPQR